MDRGTVGPGTRRPTDGPSAGQEIGISSDWVLVRAGARWPLDSRLSSVSGEVPSRVEFQLVEHVMYVVLDGLEGHSQTLGDFLVAEPALDQRHDLDLSGGETYETVTAVATRKSGDAAEQDLGFLRGAADNTGSESLDLLAKIIQRVVVSDAPSGPRFDGGDEVRLQFCQSDHQDRQRGSVLPQQSSLSEPVASWYTEVENGQRRPSLAEPRQQDLHLRLGSDDLHVVLAVQVKGQAVAKEAAAMNDRDAYSSLHGRYLRVGAITGNPATGDRGW